MDKLSDLAEFMGYKTTQDEQLKNEIKLKNKYKDALIYLRNHSDTITRHIDMIIGGK